MNLRLWTPRFPGEHVLIGLAAGIASIEPKTACEVQLIGRAEFDSEPEYWRGQAVDRYHPHPIRSDHKRHLM